MKVIIEKAINELENRYNKNKDNFFNEHDFHHIFFNIVHSELEPFFHPE